MRLAQGRPGGLGPLLTSGERKGSFGFSDSENARVVQQAESPRFNTWLKVLKWKAMGNVLPDETLDSCCRSEEDLNNLEGPVI